MALSRERRKAYAALLENLGKRPRAVLEKILENGSVSTYELGQLGYDQPPRAAQDLKESGVKLKVAFGKHPTTGARMAIYSLADSAEAELQAAAGRRIFPPRFRAGVLEKHGSRCNLCGTSYPAKSLSLDHRIPYIVAGEAKELLVADFQPLCGSHQRKKSWECEHCPNREPKVLATCRTCFWAFPESDFTHVATLPVRSLEVHFVGPGENQMLEHLRHVSREEGSNTADVVKQLIADFLRGRS